MDGPSAPRIAHLFRLRLALDGDSVAASARSWSPFAIRSTS
jgi:hypothetical protein